VAEVFAGREWLSLCGTPAKRKDAVDHNDSNDGGPECGHALARVVRFGKERHAGGDPENDGETMSKTFEEAERERLAPNPLDCVRPKFPDPPRRFCRRQALRSAAQAGESFFDGDVMDFHGGALGVATVRAVPRR